MPYEVVFGRAPTLPVDVTFNTKPRDQVEDIVTPREYSDEVEFSLNDVFDSVIEKLQLSKTKMQRQYNKNLRFIDYKKGQKVWLKVKHYKTGENRKLSPRRNGPWLVMDKIPNGVNFRIKNDRNEEKIVHHDRIYPVSGSTPQQRTVSEKVPEAQSPPVTLDNAPLLSTTTLLDDVTEGSLNSDSDRFSNYEPTTDSSSDNDSSSNDEQSEAGVHRYPQRVRHRRIIHGAVPWSDVQLSP